jgi:hypothetical protein
MPRCQRTFRRLTDAAACSGGAVPERHRSPGQQRTWNCPHCPDRETYAAITDPDLLHFGRIAEGAAVSTFGAPPDASRTVLLLRGLRPECVLERSDRRYDIYLQRDGDPLQLRLQIGHEMVHRVCSRGRVFHWTHEMLACLFSVRLLRQQGFAEYAGQQAEQYRAESAFHSADDLFRTDLWSAPIYPHGYYGRAYVVGCALERAVGWRALADLGRAPAAPGDAGPDVAAWIAGLPANARSAARDALTGLDRDGATPRTERGFPITAAVK